MIITCMSMKSSHGEKRSWIVKSAAGTILWVIISMSIWSSTWVFFLKFVTGAVTCNDDLSSGSAVDNQIGNGFDDASLYLKRRVGCRVKSTGDTNQVVE